MAKDMEQKQNSLENINIISPLIKPIFSPSIKYSPILLYIRPLFIQFNPYIDHEYE